MSEVVILYRPRSYQGPRLDVVHARDLGRWLARTPARLTISRHRVLDEAERAAREHLLRGRLPCP